MTIDADHFTPDVPTEGGEEHAVRFTKGGREYRIVLAEPNVWVIHRAFTPREEFELVLENPDRARKVFDASVRNGGFQGTALGHSLTFVISQFC